MRNKLSFSPRSAVLPAAVLSLAALAGCTGAKTRPDAPQAPIQAATPDTVLTLQAAGLDYKVADSRAWILTTTADDRVEAAQDELRRAKWGVEDAGRDAKQIMAAARSKLAPVCNNAEGEMAKLGLGIANATAQCKAGAEDLPYSKDAIAEAVAACIDENTKDPNEQLEAIRKAFEKAGCSALLKEGE